MLPSSIRDNPMMPIASALLGVACLSLMDAFMKGGALLAGAYSATLMRSIFGTAIILPVWLGLGGRWPAPSVLKLHLLRGSISAFMALSFFYALTKLPIAEAIAISFIAPLIALYLAAIFLGEVISRKAVIASLLGLAGTIVIVSGQIGGESYSDDTLLGLAAMLFSALLYACNFIVIRKQALVSSPIEATVFHSGVAAVVLAVFAPWFFTLPGVDALTNIGAAALLTVFGALAITWAYARAEAQLLVPLEYSGFLWAALFGWLFFKEAVTAPTIAGTVLIVLGCWIAARKRTEQTAI
ncbi:DMT family transporter [Altererythrobacter sp. ZODW24]|uniref:DMT family transporter n=1 Tax=Altererythrobacter sp. ZODW24 TaxID=2185142 RepID=UPI000DF7A245|nr:DMT family transporter [Altererythrobacter sp. ZODW24]